MLTGNFCEHHITHLDAVDGDENDRLFRLDARSHRLTTRLQRHSLTGSQTFDDPWVTHVLRTGFDPAKVCVRDTPCAMHPEQIALPDLAHTPPRHAMPTARLV